MPSTRTDQELQQQLTLESIIVEVADSVGLAEGAFGVRDVLGAIARSEPVSVRELSRLAQIPVPIVAAICNELRARGIVDLRRPVRLTDTGRAAVGPLASAYTGRCSICNGTGVAASGHSEPLAAALAELAAHRPAARLELDQTHCTVGTAVRRVLMLQDAGLLDGANLLMIGDDDLISLAVALAASSAGAAGRRGRLTVVDIDPDLLSFIERHAPVPIEVVQHDLRTPLPAGLAGSFDAVYTDPPYSMGGAELFLSRAAQSLAPGGGRHVFFSFGARRPNETLKVQQLFVEMGFTLRACIPNFNDYVGAGILGGTSNMYHLRSTGSTAPALAGSFDGPLYTAETRGSAARSYACQGCGEHYSVGPGLRWPEISRLRTESCPSCHSRTFRPSSLVKP